MIIYQSPLLNQIFKTLLFYTLLLITYIIKWVHVNDTLKTDFCFHCLLHIPFFVKSD